METKVCVECGIEKELYSNFALEGKNGAYRRNTCKNCIKLWNALPKEERDRIKEERKYIASTKIEKTCNTCGETKPRAEFYRSKTSLDGMSVECKCCDNRRTKSRRLLAVENNLSNNKPILTEKVCSTCKKLLDISNFSLSRHNATGYSSQCKHCVNISWKEKSTDERRIQYLLTRIKSKCNAENIPFDLEITDLIIPTNCPILGIPLKFGKSDKGYTNNATESSPSVDRINPDGGYVKGNIVIISWRANRIKGNATIDELIKLAEFYKQFKN